MTRGELVRAIAVTAEVMGSQLTEAAAAVMATELAAYDSEAVAKALKRCMREVSGRLTLAVVLGRMPGQHVGDGEAWALCPKSEGETVVWTEEIAEAWGAVRGILDDQNAARMAFREAYKRAVAESDGPPKWSVSLGHDVDMRPGPIMKAIKAGRLPPQYAERLLPSGQIDPEVRRLIDGIGKRLPAATGDDLRKDQK